MSGYAPSICQPGAWREGRREERGERENREGGKDLFIEDRRMEVKV